MSRIGKMPVSLPTGVSAELLDGNVVKVKGPLGEMSQKIDPAIKVTIEDNEIKFERPTNQPRHRSMHGLYRALVNNMVVGVSQGFETKQEFVGVGYKVSVQGQLLTMSLGYSHDIQILLSDDVKAEVPDLKKGETPKLILKSCNKQVWAKLPQRSARCASRSRIRARVSSSSVNSSAARPARLLQLNN